eukprot:m.29325 g.29325  ORF g.29325 m.29325 type:complete len:99 (+) comp16077_c0_seq1:469-765(+)
MFRWLSNRLQRKKNNNVISPPPTITTNTTPTTFNIHTISDPITITNQLTPPPILSHYLHNAQRTLKTQPRTRDNAGNLCPASTPTSLRTTLPPRPNHQ